jgi:undecaprenyl-diphosphatase
MRSRLQALLTAARAWYTQRSAPEILVYVGLLLVLIGSWGFVELAEEMLEGATQPFDDWVLHSLRKEGSPHEPIGPGWLHYFFLNVTALGSGAIAILITVFLAGGLAIQGRRFAIALILVSLTGAGVLTSVLKGYFGRPRPPTEFRAVEAIELSFPSGHSFISAVLYLTLGALLIQLTPDRRMKVYIMVVAILLTVLVGSSRVYLGVHYPTDVLGGWCAGIIWATACFIAAHLLRAGRRRPALPRREEALQARES